MRLLRRNRCILYSAAVVIAAASVGARLYQLQILDQDRFRARAQSQHQREVVVQATRGAILDRHGRELAISLVTQSLFAHPWRVQDPELAAAMLAPVIDVPRTTLLRRLRSDKPFVYLRRFLDPDEVAAVRKLDLPLGPNQPFGLYEEPKRFYPRGELAVHVIGYATIDGSGVEGIEKQFDATLHGDPTVYLAQRDARNGQLLQLIRAPEKRPQPIVLTLDIVLQHIVERELDRAMRETGSRAAAALLIEPASGEVLALANRPAADLNDYGRAPAAARVNRAVVHYYEPGSTFKVVTMAAALERERVGASQRFDCENGLLEVGHRRIRDISPHTLLTPAEILARSSNIGMVKVVKTLRAGELWETIDRFGFGQRTQIELPGESPGVLRPVAAWSRQSQDSLAFGQEVGVTSLQLASAFATIANDGVQVAPRVVRGSPDETGRIDSLRPRPHSRRVLSPRVARELRDMLEQVVTSGTGTRAAVEGYSIAGKSGTAQIATAGGGYAPDRHMASFGGFAPSRAPRLALLVVLDSPRGEDHGGHVAAPVFARIITDALRYLRVPTEDGPGPETTPREQAPADRVELRESRRVAAGRVPDVLGLSLREAVALLADHGYRTSAHGHGVVTDQRPAAGSPMEPGKACSLKLERLTPQHWAAGDEAERTEG